MRQDCIMSGLSTRYSVLSLGPATTLELLGLDCFTIALLRTASQNRKLAVAPFRSPPSCIALVEAWCSLALHCERNFLLQFLTTCRSQKWCVRHCLGFHLVQVWSCLDKSDANRKKVRWFRGGTAPQELVPFVSIYRKLT